jgi:signal transduction histidine kinase
MTLSHSNGQLRLAVVDNGKGFCPKKKNGGLGLISMEERARAIGATFSVSSKPGRTSVLVRVAAIARD